MSVSKSDSLKIQHIIFGLQKEHDRLRSKFSFLKFQNLIGFTILLFSIGMIALSVVLWLNSSINTVSLIFLLAFWNSILHELEHDLIHGLYFKKNKFMMNLMLFLVWFFRPLTLNPWIRKYWHYNHHQHSGQVIDIEERGVTNGEKWGLLRFLITADLVLSFVLRFNRLKREIKKETLNGNLSKKDLKMLKKTILYGLLPFGIPFHFLFYSWMIIKISIFVEILSPSMLISSFFHFSEPILYIFVLPNLIRQFCLHFITSNMHYYGDIEDGNIIQQTQVLNSWWTLPFQLFCFNFGATHSIHHFVVNEPFYLRQMSMRKAHEIFKQEGIRFNDFGSFTKANRFH